jgi:hypothetical protein
VSGQLQAPAALPPGEGAPDSLGGPHTGCGEVTGHGDLLDCETSRMSHFVENWLIDGGKVVSPTHQPHFTPQKYYYFYVSGTQFC